MTCWVKKFGFYPQGDGQLHLDFRQSIDMIRFVFGDHFDYQSGKKMESVCWRKMSYNPGQFHEGAPGTG